jgi:membrane protein DedA with SNARE-associated domain
LCKMKMRDFLIYTTLGAMIWNAILAALGYFLYSQKELLDKYYTELSVSFLILGVLVIAYLVYKAFSYKKTS